jgi:hypothetical protein
MNVLPTTTRWMALHAVAALRGVSRLLLADKTALAADHLKVLAAAAAEQQSGENKALVATVATQRERPQLEAVFAKLLLLLPPPPPSIDNTAARGCATTRR